MEFPIAVPNRPMGLVLFYGGWRVCAAHVFLRKKLCLVVRVRSKPCCPLLSVRVVYYVLFLVLSFGLGRPSPRSNRWWEALELIPHVPRAPVDPNQSCNNAQSDQICRRGLVIVFGYFFFVATVAFDCVSILLQYSANVAAQDCVIKSIRRLYSH